ncbi:MAG: hypothetical protein CVV64_04230 [Candidatus Wallbacteria bacterium HGW-Wallbacteria-1]|jgi:hypothetical protein|uniref:Cadherin domain-containing protein n=1 Tax=Candidatus Wallbacteria bacterium HGW-Wallbacteria-1 TaxID=2013854 RepID=A0A2N1PRL4_9BACT|nr:MAG: hypothetical protein CVV64_04230 [Candidatus Wallbacteria bacterium HGW-Wallbacteria-1]
MRYLQLIFILTMISIIGQGCALLDRNVGVLVGEVAMTAASFQEEEPAITEQSGLFPGRPVMSHTVMIRRESGGFIDFEGMKITFPQKSVPIDTIVKISKYLEQEDQPVPVPVSQSYTGIYKVEPLNLLLDEPCTIKMTASSENLPLSSEKPPLGVFRYDGEHWVLQGASANSTSASANVRSLGFFKLHGDLSGNLNISFDKVKLFQHGGYTGIEAFIEQFKTPWGNTESFGRAGTGIDMIRNPSACVMTSAEVWEVRQNTRKMVLAKHLYTIAIFNKWWYHPEDDLIFNPLSRPLRYDEFLAPSEVYDLKRPSSEREGTSRVQWHQFLVTFDATGGWTVSEVPSAELESLENSTWESPFRIPGGTTPFRELYPNSRMVQDAEYFISISARLLDGAPYAPQGKMVTRSFRAGSLNPEPLGNSSIVMETPVGGSIHDAGTAIEFRASVTGPQGDGFLRMNWTSSIDGMLGQESWFRNASLSPGKHLITVTAQDISGNVISARSWITVSSTDLSPPRFISVPQDTAIYDRQYVYNAQAEEPDGEYLRFLLISSPSGMTVEADSGVLTWTPTYAHIGSNHVELRVQDPWGNIDSQTFAINVIDPLADTNAPFLEWVTPLDGDSIEGRIELRVSASDDNWLWKVKFHLITPEGKIFIGSREKAPYVIATDVTSLASGKWEFQASAIDRAGNKTLKSINVTIP